eukprot:CAMPEP_0184688670 /NCGR_PEP_ID=MMETSP0312-20130426/30226_1 /TAXON_ID=31354 /ORGANISM="Compsopogon coeruleus, Strain SAG 36.94" /LENGTH=271 /DNA_ID=CAMNT_0027145929 /DNA_START=474 /DNA_END=1290 /DNA_ORIENTATION=+
MLRGELYDASDPELVALRTHARSLVALYNATEDGAEGASQRRDIMDSLLGRYGSACFVEPPFRCDYGFNIRLGDSVYMNFDVVILDCALVDSLLGRYGSACFVEKYTPPSEIAMAQGSLLKLLLNTFGFFMSFCTISNARPPFRCDYGFNIRLGDSVYMNFDVVILDCALVTIGDHVLFGPGVHVYAATHPVEPPLRRRGYHDRELACPVSIGNNVWLGGRSVILPGVTIGDYAVIGAGAVVTRDVPAYAVVAGNPAKVIRVMQEEEIFTV